MSIVRDVLDFVERIQGRKLTFEQAEGGFVPSFPGSAGFLIYQDEEGSEYATPADDFDGTVFALGGPNVGCWVEGGPGLLYVRTDYEDPSVFFNRLLEGPAEETYFVDFDGGEHGPTRPGV